MAGKSKKATLESGSGVSSENPNRALICAAALEIKTHEIGFLKRENSNYRSSNAELKKRVSRQDSEIRQLRAELAEIQRSVTDVWRRHAELSQELLVNNNIKRPLLLKNTERVK